MTTQPPASSPPWSTTSKRLVWLVLFGLATLVIFRVRALLLPLIMAMILAYLINPLIQLIVRRTRVNRLLAIAIAYLILIAALVYIPVSVISPIVNQINAFIQNTPEYIDQIGEFFQEPIVIFDVVEIPIDQLYLNQSFSSLSSTIVDLVQNVGGQTLAIFGSLATATLSTVGWTFMVLFLSFYLVKDHQQLFQGIVQLVPIEYQNDFLRLTRQINITWHSFLRGQLVLCLAVGVIFFVIALIIDLPNALILAVIAGVMELIPTFGPILAAIPAVLVALLQSDASWVGQLMTPFWFGVLMAIIYGIIYQFENYVLVPRIIGHHLKLHPLAVVIGVLAGASIAGVLGILLAAPVIATLRLILRYIYWKLTDQEPFPDFETRPPPKSKRIQEINQLIGKMILKPFKLNGFTHKEKKRNDNG
ncbi:MAG: AI-2E family transporter [Chloroflexi bacterium]|nr:MAG: AI-2E family transporter [Chloroflexota bacterium]